MDSSGWHFVYQLVQSPPLWVLALLTLLAAAYGLKHLSDAAEKVKTRLIEALEIVVVLGVFGLIYGEEFAGHLVPGNHPGEVRQGTLILIGLLLLFCILSMLIYVMHKRSR